MGPSSSEELGGGVGIVLPRHLEGGTLGMGRQGILETEGSEGQTGWAASSELKSPGGRDSGSARNPTFWRNLAAADSQIKPFLRKLKSMGFT